MSFFGLGGFEVLVIGAIALFVLGPKRLLEGIREGRKIYTDLKRQRVALQALITEAIDLENLKKQVDLDGLGDSAKTFAISGIISSLSCDRSNGPEGLATKV